MMYDSTHCCSRGQLRVKPMNSGVFSAACGLGGLFHDGIAGSFPFSWPATSGKLSVMGIVSSTTVGFFRYLGPGGRSSFAFGWRESLYASRRSWEKKMEREIRRTAPTPIAFQIRLDSITMAMRLVGQIPGSRIRGKLKEREWN